MAKCGRPDDAGGSFRLWPTLSPLARKLLEAVACGAPHHRVPQKSCGGAGASVDAAEPLPRRPSLPGSERLAELLQAESHDTISADNDAGADVRRRMEAFEQLQRVASRLQLDDDSNSSGEGRAAAAAEVRRLTKDGVEARETLARLGAIPPLIGMLDCVEQENQLMALYALLNLGIGNELNKAAIVEAGAVHKMLHFVETGSSPSISEAIVANFLGLSALDSNKPIIAACGAIPFLLSAFLNPDTCPTARQDALRALFNLSICSANVPLLIDAGVVPSLVAAIGDMSVSERALLVLSNIVSSGEGRRALSLSADAFPVLVDVLGWCDAAACQENAVYVLMVMAHKGHSDRAAMVDAGVVSALLELTLLGTPLAQKRASRLLEILMVDKGKGVVSCCPTVSAPLCGAAAEAAVKEVEMSDERKAVKELVQQSLQSNMRRIVRRANLPPQDFSQPERLRALVATSTFKSLPF